MAIQQTGPSAGDSTARRPVRRSPRPEKRSGAATGGVSVSMRPYSAGQITFKCCGLREWACGHLTSLRADFGDYGLLVSAT